MVRVPRPSSLPAAHHSPFSLPADHIRGLLLSRSPRTTVRGLLLSRSPRPTARCPAPSADRCHAIQRRIVIRRKQEDSFPRTTPPLLSADRSTRSTPFPVPTAHSPLPIAICGPLPCHPAADCDPPLARRRLCADHSTSALRGPQSAALAPHPTCRSHATATSFGL